MAQSTYCEDEFLHEHKELYEMFDFIPPDIEEMYGYMESMDVNSSSCITGINVKILIQSLTS